MQVILDSLFVFPGSALYRGREERRVQRLDLAVYGCNSWLSVWTLCRCPVMLSESNQPCIIVIYFWLIRSFIDPT